MHNVKVPLFPRYDMPEKHDLARQSLPQPQLPQSLLPIIESRISSFSSTAFKTHNVHVKTPDNETLGAWFTFSDSFYAAHKAQLLAPSNSSSPSSHDEFIRSALRTNPTILFLHGNGATRLLASRVQHYQAFASRLRANVFAPDYRGFADSTGTPSEAGLIIDARASWDWLRAHGAVPENVLIVGNSLGTAVAVQLASVLEAEHQLDGTEEHGKVVGVSSRERPRGVVLLAPFSSVQTLLDSYYIAGFVPLFAPIRTFPPIASES
jgi:abhydrolase domain-containing protein 12